MQTEEQKRNDLKKRYENWIKTNKTRLLISCVIYLVVMIINYLFFKNERLTILASLLIFAYAIYIFSLIWFINKKLLAKIDEVDFKTK